MFRLLKEHLKYHVITNFPKSYPKYKKFLANVIFLTSKIIIHPRKNFLRNRDLIKARLILKKGDIILIGDLQEASSILLKGGVTHVALHIGNKKFIHAVADGVTYSTLHHMFTKYDTIVILRLPKKTENKRKIIKNAIKFAESQLGKPYDFDFSPGAKKFFCTELINSAYRHAGHKTKLSNFGKFRTFTEKIEKHIVTAPKALTPEHFIKGNFKVVFLSHNLSIEKGNLKYIGEHPKTLRKKVIKRYNDKIKINCTKKKHNSN
ncbi:hypothetical protein HN385_03100 [archaeon]|jgi:hypothetical protein|nr:hypothetical protein [archaeon]MBT3450824.1 hypothetical protein [archaeon]MBT6868467.1 hypothetical protein [archaeon]MBT7193566.1 hypothetical protein [archaeon]MBT7381239.1 hypothetical protein [archaeon]